MKLQMLFLSILVLALLSCSDSLADPSGNENDPNKKTGKLNIEITDAPIDNAEVKSCFVTISEIRVDGQKLSGFQKTTVDILAYQNGSTKALGEYDLEAKSYSNISLVLDYSADASGKQPGCYIEKTDGTIQAMSSSSTEIILSKSLEVKEASQAQSSYVLDMDLRKCIKGTSQSNGITQYNLVSAAELSNYIRVSDKSKAGTVKGNCGNLDASTTVVAYVYTKGSFDKNIELSQQGEGKILFKNAVSSSKCTTKGDFQLHFLNEGDYEIFFASYDKDAKGNVSFKGLFSIGGLLNQLAGAEVKVNASTTSTLNISLSGLLTI